MTHFARCNSILCTTSRKKERETGKEKPGRFSFSDPQKTSSTSLGSWQSKLIEHKHLRWWPARASPLWNSVTPDSLVNNYKSSLVARGIEVVSILPFSSHYHGEEREKKNNSQWIWVPCLSNQEAQTERWVHSLFPASALVFDEFLRRRWERRMSFNPAWFPDWITLGMQACLSVCLDDWLVWRSTRVLHWWPTGHHGRKISTVADKAIYMKTFVS